MKYLLDTNVVLYHLSGQLQDQLPLGAIFVSIITEIELLSFKELQSQEREIILKFLAGVSVLDMDSKIKAKTIEFRLKGLRLPDAAIAATARTYGATLLTHDVNLLKAVGESSSAPPRKVI